MPEFFLELFSEEIPARMQARAGIELSDICIKTLERLSYSGQNYIYGPRRIAIYGSINHSFGTDGSGEVRGPREGASDAALDGFARKTGIARVNFFIKNGFYIAPVPAVQRTASDIIQTDLRDALLKFPWPKSMRWGQSGEFTWVRPLRRVVCLFDGKVIPIPLGPIIAGNETEGHRIHAPGAFAVSSASDWKEKLRAHFVIADQDERRRMIADGIASKAAALGLSVAPDEALLNEVTGLVEWPVPLIGKIDLQFMELPWEVRELSMKVNQKYFALRDANGNPAPYFAFVANLEAMDGGAAIIAGNERVLRARLADARHFWEMDLKTPLNDLLPKLEKITFHAKVGSQRERVARISELAGSIAASLGSDVEAARSAGLLCKADLVTGMVGEFPELQGIMGGYYAGPEIGPAIKTHYQPKGPSDAVPVGIVAASVALADKLDTLTKFFEIGEKPTGSGDPYALRRAALGVIRIILENELRLPLNNLISDVTLLDFINERLRVKLRTEGERFDVLDAVLAIARNNDLLRTIQRVKAISDFLKTEDGNNLLIGYRRAANILKIENANDGPHGPEQSSSVFITPEEAALQKALSNPPPGATDNFNAGVFGPFITWLATLRPHVDVFFDKVTVNTPDQQLRRARLGLLAQLVDRMLMIADFSKIEG